MKADAMACGSFVTVDAVPIYCERAGEHDHHVGTGGVAKVRVSWYDPRVTQGAAPGVPDGERERLAQILECYVREARSMGGDPEDARVPVYREWLEGVARNCAEAISILRANPAPVVPDLAAAGKWSAMKPAVGGLEALDHAEVRDRMFTILDKLPEDDAAEAGRLLAALTPRAAPSDVPVQPVIAWVVESRHPEYQPEWSRCYDPNKLLVRDVYTHPKAARRVVSDGALYHEQNPEYRWEFRVRPLVYADQPQGGTRIEPDTKSAEEA